MIEIVLSIEGDAKIPGGVTLCLDHKESGQVNQSEKRAAIMYLTALQMMLKMSPNTIFTSGEKDYEEKKKIFGDILESGQKDEG